MFSNVLSAPLRAGQGDNAGTAATGVIAQERFVNTLEEKFKCPICWELLNNPTQCPRGHVFCFECIHRVARESSPCVCPMDREKFVRNQLHPNLFVQNCVNELQVKCVNYERTDTSVQDAEVCSWIGALHKVEKHEMDECLFSTVPCTSIGCAERIQRRHLAEHVAICPHRLVNCNYCSKSIKHGSIAVHESECDKYPVDCPNLCGAVQIIRKEHLPECPLELVDCPLYEMKCCFPLPPGGSSSSSSSSSQAETCPPCNGQVQRCALKSHVSSQDLTQAVMLLCTQVKSLKEKNEDTERVVSTLKRKYSDRHSIGESETSVSGSPEQQYWREPYPYQLPMPARRLNADGTSSMSNEVGSSLSRRMMQRPFNILRDHTGAISRDGRGPSLSSQLARNTGQSDVRARMIAIRAEAAAAAASAAATSANVAIAGRNSALLNNSTEAQLGAPFDRHVTIHPSVALPHPASDSSAVNSARALRMNSLARDVLRAPTTSGSGSRSSMPPMSSLYLPPTPPLPSSNSAEMPSHQQWYASLRANNALAAESSSTMAANIDADALFEETMARAHASAVPSATGIGGGAGTGTSTASGPSVTSMVERLNAANRDRLSMRGTLAQQARQSFPLPSDDSNDGRPQSRRNPLLPYEPYSSRISSYFSPPAVPEGTPAAVPMTVTGAATSSASTRAALTSNSSQPMHTDPVTTDLADGFYNSDESLSEVVTFDDWVEHDPFSSSNRLSSSSRPERRSTLLSRQRERQADRDYRADLNSIQMNAARGSRAAQRPEMTSSGTSPAEQQRTLTESTSTTSLLRSGASRMRSDAYEHVIDLSDYGSIDSHFEERVAAAAANSNASRAATNGSSSSAAVNDSTSSSSAATTVVRSSGSSAGATRQTTREPLFQENTDDDFEQMIERLAASGETISDVEEDEEGVASVEDVLLSDL